MGKRAARPRSLARRRPCLGRSTGVFTDRLLGELWKDEKNARHGGPPLKPGNLGPVGCSTWIDCSCQLTEKAPSEPGGAEGAAVIRALVGAKCRPAPPPTPAMTFWRSSCASVDQPGSVIVPVCSPTVAVALENATFPKSVSASVSQALELAQTEGASTIHSAEETSMAETRFVVVKRVPVLRSRILSVTSCPRTVTDAVISLPGYTLSFRFTGAAGMSSYQVE